MSTAEVPDVPPTNEASVEVEAVTSTTEDGEEGGSILQQHSNENLLKIDTHDKYSTVGAIKKYVIKQLPPPITQEPPLPLFPGLVRIGKNPKNPHIFMAFASAEQREAALKHLTSLSYRQFQWVETEISDRDLQLTHKGKPQQEQHANKRARDETSDATCSSTSATMSICQWSDVPLDEQIARKEKHCISVMKKILQPNHQNGFVSYRTRFLGVMRSAQTEGYRNHVNFTYGRLENKENSSGGDADGSSSSSSQLGEVILGFNEGALVAGKLRIERADQAGNVTTHPLAMIIVGASMALCSKVRAAAPNAEFPLEVLDRVNGSGFWRRLQVRHNVRGELMLCMELDPTSLPAGLDFQQDVVPLIVAAYTSHEVEAQLAQVQATARVVSIQYYAHTGTNSPQFDAQRTVLFGTPALTESLMGLSFDLSPAAFFQVNTPAFEDLLHKVHEVAKLNKNTVLLDLCCGTGTIGLCLARHVKRVIGIELISSAVDNARINASRNHISNATFLAGRVENLLPDVINSLSMEDRADVVAILDPPRAGVHNTVIKWIRSTESIRRAVYISCEQKALENDCPGFTKPATNSYRGTPFIVESGFGVDLFPHTPHVEMIAVLDRTKQPAAVVAVEPLLDAVPLSASTEHSAVAPATSE
jgi:tRNA (uracil-5-)-methyltransferase